MRATHSVAQQVEGYGCRMFSSIEVAFNILGLMHLLLFSIAQVEPISADLNGGTDRTPDLAGVTTKIRTDLSAQSALCKSITRDCALDYNTVNGPDAAASS